MFFAGEENLLDDDAVTVGGSNHSHATADLQVGSCPPWHGRTALVDAGCSGGSFMRPTPCMRPLTQCET